MKITEETGAKESVPQREILSILNVPIGKMGYVIGKRGFFIQFVQQFSKYVFM
jgi:transcription antitermination factor NusA-like protein